MPTYQQLLKGALTRLAKRQGEMDELAAPVAQKIQALSQAESRFADPELQALKLYHGSPHEFDRFNFLDNLLKGEGAIAFGPGGYFSGYGPLGKSYAEALASRMNRKVPPATRHKAMVEALQKNPEATTEYLRAMNAEKLNRVFKNTGDDPLVVGAGQLFGRHGDTLDGRWAGARVIQPLGIENYLGKVVQTGVDVKPRIGRGGDSPDEVVRKGLELRKAVGELPTSRTTYKKYADLQDAISRGDQFWPSVRSFVHNAREVPRGERVFDMIPELVEKTRRELGIPNAGHIPTWEPFAQNLRATNAAMNEHLRPQYSNPGPKYSASMQDRFSIRPRDLDALVASLDRKPTGRYLYDLELPTGPEHLLPYDYPVKVASPKVLGGLHQLADKYGIEKLRDPNITGAELMSMFRDKQIPELTRPVQQMQAMKEAGIPAMYFLRGGRRDAKSVIPDKFNPEDYNFVTFDDDFLPVPNRTAFATGGPV